MGLLRRVDGNEGGVRGSRRHIADRMSNEILREEAKAKCRISKKSSRAVAARKLEVGERVLQPLLFAESFEEGELDKNAVVWKFRTTTDIGC